MDQEEILEPTEVVESEAERAFDITTFWSFFWDVPVIQTIFQLGAVAAAWFYARPHLLVGRTDMDIAITVVVLAAASLTGFFLYQAIGSTISEFLERILPWIDWDGNAEHVA
jgi:hypothetical protein